VNDIVELLRQCLIIMVTSTGGGALIGGLAGGIGGAGVGAIPAPASVQRPARRWASGSSSSWG
jgi:hypothetical protein